jgi:oligoendopeptidase F
MFETLDPLPATAAEFSTWTWPRIAPYYADLVARPLNAANVEAWLTDWTALGALLDEVNTRFTVATTANTADEATASRYTTYLDEIAPQAMAAEQQVKQHLIASDLEPRGFAVPLRKLRTDAALFRGANVAPLAELRKLSLDYDKISGARTVHWEGREIPLVQLHPVLEEPGRGRRELAWRAMRSRIIADTDALATLWRQMMAVRRQIARNAGCDNYRSYRWQQMYRFDYTPEDAKRFHAAIEEVVVPVVRRLNARRRKQLGVTALRPWDLDVDPLGHAALHPYQTLDELESRISAVFGHVDPRFSGYFESMRAEGLLDLESREHKAEGGYMLECTVTRRPFIFMNAVGTQEDVATLLHEGGHAFHAFEMAPLPYLQQRQEQMLPMEFCEVASTAMELLGAPYLTRECGGFYTESEAARMRTQQLCARLQFWPYMAMIDALQHWIYEHEEAAADLERCDEEWVALAERFAPDVDWSGLEPERRTFWHHQAHVFQDPFYYIEYGLAQLGAVQIWANARRDPAGAVAAYRRALALGGTAPLPELYATAGARFAFDAATLRGAVEVIEATLAELEPATRA